MELSLFNYSQKDGWSVKDFPNLDSEKTLILIFGASSFKDNQKPFQQLARAYPQSHMVGCSTAGEIFNTDIMDESLAVAVIQFKNVDIKTHCQDINSPDESFEIGKNIASQLHERDLRSILILSNGINVNGTALVNGFRNELPASVIITGGLAGDGPRFKQTWVINKAKGMCTNCIMGIGLYGDDLMLSYGSKGGWDIFGPERVITRSEGNILYEIDYQPALALYKHYLGERSKELPASGLLYPLAIRKNDTDKEPIVRTILAVDEDNQSMTFAGDVPQNWTCQLMHANFDRIIDGASDAINMAINQLDVQNPPLLALAISCIGRRLVLGERAVEEVEATFEVLPPSSQQIGFYSYGEISPSGVANCDLHNQTMTLTIIGEK